MLVHLKQLKALKLEPGGGFYHFGSEPRVLLHTKDASLDLLCKIENIKYQVMLFTVLV